MKSNCGLLKKGLLKTEDLTMSADGFICYSAEVCPDERMAALSNMYDTFEAGERVAGTHNTTVHLAPIHISANDYLAEANNDAIPQNEHVNLHYGMSELVEGYKWDSPYKVEKGEYTTEELSSTFATYSLNNEIQGTFTFALSLVRSIDNICFRVDLPLVYVRPQHRKKTTGLDLTIAVARLATEVYKNIILSYRGKIPIDVTIFADFESKGGERLANLVVDEFRYRFDMLTESHPKCANRLGEIYEEMGY